MNLKPSLTHLLIAACLLALTCGLILYVRLPGTDITNCADCMHYAMNVDAKIQGAGNVRGNAQFFRYALDTSCRGALLASKRCPVYRRKFLADARRYMDAVERPYEACRGIGVCG